MLSAKSWSARVIGAASTSPRCAGQAPRWLRRDRALARARAGRIHPTCDGCAGLRDVGARGRSRIDRRAATSVRGGGDSTLPVAAHARHDHGAARARLLNVMGIADAHRVRAWIIAWHNIPGCQCPSLRVLNTGMRFSAGRCADTSVADAPCICARRDTRLRSTAVNASKYTPSHHSL